MLRGREDRFMEGAKCMASKPDLGIARGWIVLEMGGGLFRVYPCSLATERLNFCTGERGSGRFLDSCENILWWAELLWCQSDSRANPDIWISNTWASFLNELLPLRPLDTHGAAEIWTCRLFSCAGSVIRRYHAFRFPHGDPKDRMETGIREGRSNEGAARPSSPLDAKGWGKG